MGSCYISGHYSKIPIKYSNEIYVLLCYKINNKIESIGPPIFGKYDDYGGVYSISNCPIKTFYEELLGDDIENIISIFNNKYLNDIDQSSIVFHKLSELMKKNFIREDLKLENLLILVDHSFIYEELSDRDRCIDLLNNYCVSDSNINNYFILDNLKLGKRTGLNEDNWTPIITLKENLSELILEQFIKYECFIFIFGDLNLKLENSILTGRQALNLEHHLNLHSKICKKLEEGIEEDYEEDYEENYEENIEEINKPLIPYT